MHTRQQSCQPHGSLLLQAPPLPTVRVGMIGLGRRGLKTLRRYAAIEGVEIAALSDIDAAALHKAQQILASAGRRQAKVFSQTDGWKRLCALGDIDLVYILTDWNTHATMATFAMEQGRHVAVEVPAATTVEECWALVNTAERTRRHCFMTENCCYDGFSLATKQMAEEGLLGHITHCDGAYIHNLRPLLGLDGNGQGASAEWVARFCAAHTGNVYPTHAIGPIGWLLGLHRGDRMDYLVALTSKGCGKGGMLGRVNTTLIHTVRGRSIALQLDMTTPRPYNRLQAVCGTRGFAQKYPVPTLQLPGRPLLAGKEAEAEATRFLTSKAGLQWSEGRARQVANEMNYAMDMRLISCLRGGLPLDIDVYDAAEWSCLAELSEQSARNGSVPVAIPDFTRGHWNDIAGHRFY